MSPLLYNLLFGSAIMMFVFSNIYVVMSVKHALEQKTLDKMESVLRNLLAEKAYLNVEQEEGDLTLYTLKTKPVNLHIWVTRDSVYCKGQLYLFNGLKKIDIIEFLYDRPLRMYREQLKTTGQFSKYPKERVYEQLFLEVSDKIARKVWNSQKAS